MNKKVSGVVFGAMAGVIDVMTIILGSLPGWTLERFTANHT